MDSSSAWWDEEAEYDTSLNGESCSMVQGRDASTLSQFPGVQSSWSIPVEGSAEDSGNRSGPSSASRSHSLAEKRRRDRINAQLATLRKLIPQSDKMDKAALLGSVIDQVKDLKRKASEISRMSLVPTETDEVHIELEVPKRGVNTNILGGNSNSSVLIRASVCCDDRPELFGELVRVLRGMRLTTVKADMTSVGGRIRSILVLCSEDGEEGFCVSSLKQSLRVVLSRIAASASMATNYRSIRSKRQRFFLPR